MGSFSTRGQITQMNCTIRLKFDFVRDFIPDLDICKFKEVAIKSEGTLPRTRSHMGLFSTQGQVTLR